MTDTASLQIFVDSNGVTRAKDELGKFVAVGGKAERATDGLTGSLGKLVGGFSVAAIATAGFMKLVNTQREFDKLNAGLITATGSAENAAVAFGAIQDFAQDTPYDLAQVTDSFTKLVNYGLTPSERALTSYGNTASSLGKELNMMIEAVADAATGEFERLKEFGIRASKQGDQVKFTFRGVSETVGFSASEIEDYLIKLGENNFAGAMEQRMKTLDGALSNLDDEISKLFLNISNSGIGEVIAAGVRLAIDALAEISAMFASGEIAGYIQALAHRFGWLWDGFKLAVSTVWDIVKAFYNFLHSEGNIVGRTLTQVFGNFFENVKAFWQLLVVEAVISFEEIKAYAIAFKDGLKAIFTGDTVANVVGRLTTQLDNLGQARQESIDEIMAERQASIDNYNNEITAARNLREEYKKTQEEKKKASEGTDRLAGFAQGGGGKATKGVDEAAQKKRASEFKQLQDGLRTDEEAVAHSYLERTRIIKENTKEESNARRDLMARSQKQYDEELEELRKKKGAELEEIRASLLTEEQTIQESFERRRRIVEQNATSLGQRDELVRKLQAERDEELKGLEENKQHERDALYNGLLTQEEAIKQSYDQRKQDILEATNITEMERQDLLRRLEKQFADERANLEKERIKSQLGAAEQLFGGLADLAKTYGGEQSKAYRVLFSISKAFSVAQAIMSIQTGLAKAQELGFPANLAEMARVAATGAGILATIRGSNISGAYDEGGKIPAGKLGIVGEYGPELVRGPANVTGRKDTADLLGKSEATQTKMDVTVPVRIINILDPELVADYLGSDAGERLVMNTVRKNGDQVRALATGTGG